MLHSSAFSLPYYVYIHLFIITTNCLPLFLSPSFPLFPPQILRPDSLTNGGTVTPSISIEVPDESNHSNPPSSTPSSANHPTNQKQRRKPALFGLPQITESSDDNKGGGGGGLLQVKEQHNSSGKRHSLTPESSRREMVPLQPSRSLDLGALPTWRNKTFISLHNYWTGEQQSDRLHMQAKAVRASSPLPPFPSTFLSLNSPFLISLSLFLPSPPHSLILLCPL